MPIRRFWTRAKSMTKRVKRLTVTSWARGEFCRGNRTGDDEGAANRANTCRCQQETESTGTDIEHITGEHRHQIQVGHHQDSGRQREQQQCAQKRALGDHLEAHCQAGQGHRLANGQHFPL